MTLGDAFQIAVEALIANKLRAALTMLGIIIGVGAVIALMAVGQGSQKAVTDRISGLGSNLLFIRPGSSSSGGVQGGAGSAQTLTVADADAIIAGVPNVIAVAPEAGAALQVLSTGRNTFTRVTGATPDYASVTSLTVASGSFITDDDISRASRAVVVGSTVATNLFGDGADPVGQQIRVSQGRNVITLTVAGVLAPKGGNATNSSDDRIFLPLTTVQKQILGARMVNNSPVVSQITVQVASKGKLDQVKVDIQNLLSQQHKVVSPDFTVESQDDLAAAASQVAQTLTVLLGSIAGISLVVGGIGIMNIMLVSVTERTREIGIRKAVGARSGDILTQFLTEALMVTAFGGLLGVAGGVGGAFFLNGKDIPGLGDNVQTAVSWSSVIIAFVVSAAIGIFFGLYPAQRAAKMRPIDALRYE